MTPRFHRLDIAEVRQETREAISVRFDVPPSLRGDYTFAPGQHLTLKALIDGKEIRRTYSICAAADEGSLRIAIKHVPGGRFSSWALEHLQPGQSIDVMTPDGRFNTALDPAQRKHYVAFAAGSGITPVLSLIGTTLAREPHSRFSLFYGNRRQADVLFHEELQALKDRYLSRFALYQLFSGEQQDIELLNGRLDTAKIKLLTDGLLPPEDIDEVFICGPGNMIDAVESALLDCAVPPQRIHVERFGLPDPAHALHQSQPGDAASAQVNVIIDGVRRSFAFHQDDPSLLDAALAAGIDLPYSCKGGMCCTCRSRVLDGRVRMDKNYSLEKEDLDAGFVLTCQAHPLTDALTLSFDDR